MVPKTFGHFFNSRNFVWDYFQWRMNLVNIWLYFIFDSNRIFVSKWLFCFCFEIL